MNNARLIVFVTAIAASTVLYAASQENSADTIDPLETKTVLTALLSVANENIPAGSTCSGDYADASGKSKIKDLLAMQLAFLDKGENVIKGKCQGDKKKSCTLSITHRHGEDIFSAKISFYMQDDKVKVNTLSCMLTP